MKGIALIGLHAINAGQSRRRQDTVGQDHIACAHPVTPVRRHRPAARGLVPGGLTHGGVKQAALVEAIFLRHLLAVFENFEAGGELHGGEIFHLLQQWQIAVGFNIAGDTGISVPIPGAAHVAAFFAKPHVVKTGGAQLVPQHKGGETGAYHEDFAFVRQRLPLHRGGGIDILEIFAECAFHGHVVGRALALFLEFMVFRLFLGVEDGAGRRGRQCFQRLVINHRITFSGYVGGSLGGARVEFLQTGRRINLDWQGRILILFAPHNCWRL